MKLTKEERQSLKRLLNDTALLCQDSTRHLNEPEMCTMWLRGAAYRIAVAREMIRELAAREEGDG